jgi:hypothetical protein
MPNPINLHILDLTTFSIFTPAQKESGKKGW